MLFPTIDFAVFFLVAFSLCWLLSPFPTPWKLCVLVLSYAFYAFWDPKFVLLLVVETAIAHVGARLIVRASGQQARKRWMVASVAGLLGILGYFKYAGFFAVNLDNLLRSVGLGNLIPLVQPTLPIAISFFTFSTSSCRPMMPETRRTLSFSSNASRICCLGSIRCA